MAIRSDLAPQGAPSPKQPTSARALPRIRSACVAVTFLPGLLIYAAGPTLAQAQAPAPGLETGDAGAAPRNVIPWLREALETPEPEAGAPTTPRRASAPKRTPKAAAKPAPQQRDAFSLFGASRAKEDKARNAKPEQSFRRPAGRGAAAAPSAVEIGRLKAVDGSAAGLLTAKKARLPVDAWRGVSSAEAVAALDKLKPGPYRAANLLAIRTLSAALAAPKDAEGPQFLKARIDALLRFGAARQAALLAATAGEDFAALGVDAALASGQEAEVCAALTARHVPSMERIYCQIAAGDHLSASLAIEAARALGRSDETTLALLEALALQGTAQDLSAKEKQAKPTPLRLAALRRLGVAPPSDFARDAPLSLLQAALSEKAPPRLRLEALERLEQSGAVETSELAEAFAAFKSAESGGVWGRVEAYKRALQAKDNAFAAAVSAALDRAKAAGRRASMARLLAPEIARRALPVSGADPSAALLTPALRRTLRQGGEPSAAAAVSRSAARLSPKKAGPDAVEAALDYLAEPKWPGAWTPERAAMLAAAQKNDARAQFAQAALKRLEKNAAPAASAKAEIEAGRAAHLALSALAQLGDLLGGSDSGARKAGLAAIEVFHALGWRDEARALAIEIAEET